MEINKYGNEVIQYGEQDKGESRIVIHITGEVKNKGILELKKGDRIADAIEEAGGTTSEANLDDVNLAYILEDGLKIYIPNKKDKMQDKEYISRESGNNVIIQDKTAVKKVNINEASLKELEELPGIGEGIAKKIIEYRNKNGKFKKIEDLQNVKGIGENKFANIKKHICVK